MPIAELIDYIKTQTQEGVSAQELRVALMEAGWHEVDIENGLHDVAAGLRPATPGSSIHEDLAQVRGMVAHLAVRIKDVEKTIASLASDPTMQALPTQGLLPSTYIGAERELMVRHSPSRLYRVMSAILTMLCSVSVAQYGASLVHREAVALQDYHIMIGAFGILVLILSVVFLRQGRAWLATLLSFGVLIVWAFDVDMAWRTYHSLDQSVAIALWVLFVVIAGVIRRWSIRLAR